MLTVGDQTLRALERRVQECPRDVTALVALVSERRRRGDLAGAYDDALRARSIDAHDDGVREALDAFPAWPGFRGGAGRAGASGTRAPRRTPRVRWVRPLEGTVHTSSTPLAVAVSGSRVFVTLSQDVYGPSEEGGLAAGRPRAHVFALDADDGTVLWSREVLGLPSAPVHAGRLVLVATWRAYDVEGEPPAGAYLLAFDARTGAPLFRDVLPARPNEPPLVHVHPPLVVEDRAIFATSPFLADEGRARIGCVDLSRGTLAWSQERARLVGEPAADAGSVFVRSAVDWSRGSALQVEALALEDGRRRFAPPITRGAAGDGAIVAASGKLLVLENQVDHDVLRCYRADTGAPLWKKGNRNVRWRRFHPPVVAGGSVLLPIEERPGVVRLALYCLETGSERNEAMRPELDARRLSTADGVVVGSGGVVGLARDALEPLWQVPSLRADDARERTEDLAVAHGRILGVARSGVAFCFEETPPPAACA